MRLSSFSLLLWFWISLSKLTIICDCLSFDASDIMLPASDKEKYFQKMMALTRERNRKRKRWEKRWEKKSFYRFKGTQIPTPPYRHSQQTAPARGWWWNEGLCVFLCVHVAEHWRACVKQHEPMMEFVVTVSKEPEAVITSSAEPFRKIVSLYEMAKCLSAFCVCVSSGVLVLL